MSRTLVSLLALLSACLAGPACSGRICTLSPRPVSTTTSFEAVAETGKGLRFRGTPGPGRDTHIVFLAGDEEYRSEETLPTLAKLLAKRHGFTCTVLFAMDADNEFIDPDASGNIPGLEVLEHADALVLFTRFRRLPDADMQHIVDFVESGRPLLGLRTATHAFAYEDDSSSEYAHWSWNNSAWPGGFGKQVLGETWVAHHGRHGSESTRGLVEPSAAGHPILRGVDTLWGPTDVYAIRQLPADATVLVRGAVLDGMTRDSEPVNDARNAPMMPIVWTRARALDNGQTQRVVASTLGASVDFADEGVRRVLVNACFWIAGLESKITPDLDVRTVGDFEPTMFGFGNAVKHVKPEELAFP
ncbi:MAG: hypothetical protein DHS20C15_05350 [Planctomycetota bacterium]|nr:MAG: hypothetical protein DHS20C15_05350 [Planctomycetota bacterium]